MKQLINILTVFLGVIGCCTAILVCFILFIYPRLDSTATSKDSESPIQNTAITLEDTSVVSDQIGLQPQSEETDPGNLLPETKSDGEPLKSGTYTIDDIEFWFSDLVINDVTGRWRISSIASPKDITEYAVDYYNTFFSSDNEIHAITNFSLNTTTSISVISDGMLDVAVHEYVSGEEHDANTLFSGMLLAEYFIDLNTGEAENILDNRDNSDYSAGNADPYIQSKDTNSSNENNFNTDATPDSQVSPSVNDTVWLSAENAKYHSINNCGQMTPDKAYQVSLEQAISEGYEKCDKCF